MSQDLMSPVCVFVLITILGLTLLCINNGMSADDRSRRYRNAGILGGWLVIQAVTFAIYMIAWQSGHPAGASGHLSADTVRILTWVFLAGLIGGFSLLFFVWAKLTPEVEEAEEMVRIDGYGWSMWAPRSSLSPDELARLRPKAE